MAIRRAIALYPDRQAWEAHQREAMSRDFGWERPAQAYLDVYAKALAAHRAA